MSPDSDSIAIAKLYRLKDDGSNWAVYRDRTTDYLKSKGLRSHLNGRVTKPIELIERWDESLNTIKLYIPTDTEFQDPLSAVAIDRYESKSSEFDRLEGLGSDVLNNTIPTSVYREIHHLPSLAAKWKALHTMFEHRGNVVQIDILAKLQSARYTGGPMRAFLSQLTEWRNDLLDNDYNLSDSQFVTYIISSFAAIPDYRTYISSIEGAAEVAGTTLTSEVLKKRLIAEHEARNGINSYATSSGPGSTALASGNRRRMEYFCTICNVHGHSKERCFAEGGGRHDQAPEWYKKKQADRLSQEPKSTPTPTPTSNVTQLSYTCVAEGVIHTSTALSASNASAEFQGTILDCGASEHFTPHRHLLTDFVELHEYTKVADNRTIYIEGRGTMVVDLPMGKGQPPTKLTLTNVYYVPSFVFTLISTTRMDLAGFAILKRNGLSTITAPDGIIVGRVPLIRGLYRVTDPIGTSNMSNQLHANVSIITPIQPIPNSGSSPQAPHSPTHTIPNTSDARNVDVEGEQHTSIILHPHSNDNIPPLSSPDSFSHIINTHTSDFIRQDTFNYKARLVRIGFSHHSNPIYNDLYAPIITSHTPTSSISSKTHLNQLDIFAINIDSPDARIEGEC